MTRGHRGSLLLRCRAFSSLSSCRFIPAHPTVTAELQRAGLPPANYIDTGIGFTVILRPSVRRAAPRLSLNTTELRVYDALADGQKTIAELQDLLGIQPPTLRKALRSLRSRDLVQQHGGRGQTTWYQQTSSTR
jgi:ATP-dependent DNA helicase RecG